MINPSYSEYIESIHSGFVSLSEGPSSRTSELIPLAKFKGLSLQPRVMILSPHPDDECLMAGPALRMQEEWGASVTVVPYSYGSDRSRRESRSLELKAAVKTLGFDLFDPRVSDEMDKLSFSELLGSLKTLDPEILITSHSKDRHPTHIESAIEAHSVMNQWGKSLWWLQSEYWAHAESPNLFIELSPAHLIKMGEALLCHQGEVSRNPYHLSLPGWLMDQSRRAPEMIQGFGKRSKASVFGQLLTCTQINSAAS